MTGPTRRAGTRPGPVTTAALLAALVVLLDQASKYIILEQVMRPPRVIEVTGFFNLVLAWNPGVSFSLFASDDPRAPWLLTGHALAIVTGLILWLVRLARVGRANGWIAAGTGLVAGGALGNVIDRLRFGAVADFLDFHLAGFHWPAFNLADFCITTGVILILIEAFYVGARTPK